MRFMIHGSIDMGIAAVLERHRHKAHGPDELLEDQPASGRAGIGSAAVPDPRELLDALSRRQWFLLTSDSALVHGVFEEKIAYAGVIVLLIDTRDAAAQSDAIDRLFERYKRLTPKRLYTVTANRVKVRQLPGNL